jgi:acyl-CoA thioester hydrolase
MKSTILLLEQFPHKHLITTRWHDNDVYGHVNNVVYYSWFDTAVNAYLIEQGVLDYKSGETVGLVVKTQCNYFKPVAFPDTITVGVAVARIGNSSVRYELGIFKNKDNEASASGHFIHVYVDKSTHRPVKIPEPLRHALRAIENTAFGTT